MYIPKNNDLSNLRDAFQFWGIDYSARQMASAPGLLSERQQPESLRAAFDRLEARFLQAAGRGFSHIAPRLAA